MSNPAGNPIRHVCLGLGLVAYACGCGDAEEHAQPRVLSDRLSSPIALAIDDEAAYCADGRPYSGKIRRIALDGSSHVALAEGQSPIALTVDGTHVYWINTSSDTNVGLYRVPKEGGAVEQLGEQNAPSLGIGVAADETSVFWGRDGSLFWTGNLMKLDKLGGQPQSIADGVEGQFGHVKVVNGYVYWITAANNKGQIKRTPVGGGATETVVDDGGYPWELAFYGSNMYWTEFPPVLPLDRKPVGSVWSLSLDGGAPVRLAGAQEYPFGIAVDATSAYFTNFEMGSAGTVMKVPRQGGPTELVAGHQNGPHTIAVNDTTIFWINFADETLVSMPK